MRLLLDTCAFIRMTDEVGGLPHRACELIEDGRNEVFLSVASLWEMTIKVDLGKLRLGRSPADLARREISQNSLRLLPAQLDHFDELSRLPSFHRDPFDRLLVAQARAGACGGADNPDQRPADPSLSG